jgi:hypothetical protein
LKKIYSKPDIFFEDFSISTNIAAGCEEKPSLYNDSVSACGVKWAADVYIFTENIDGCNRKLVDGQQGEYNGLCYHNPSDNYNVFYS